MSTTGKRPGFGFIPAILAGLSLARGSASRRRNAAPPEGAIASDGPGYETSDVHVGNTALVMAGLAAFALVAVGIMIWLMHGFASSQRQALPSLTRQQTTPLTPPTPNLQSHPYADIDAEQAGRLDGYAFTDATRQRARIPIDRAMELTVGRTLDP